MRNWSQQIWYSDTESFICNYCVLGYHTAKERARHHHFHQETYKCHDCDYKNVRQDHLSEHMLKKHSKVGELVRKERKQKRGGVPLTSVSKTTSITEIDSNTSTIFALHIFLPQQNNTSVQTGPELFDAACQTNVKSNRFVGSPFPVDDCAEVANPGSTSTRFTQTVTVIRNTNWQKIISNPHPDAYCAGSSFQKES